MASNSTRLWYIAGIVLVFFQGMHGTDSFPIPMAPTRGTAPIIPTPAFESRHSIIDRCPSKLSVTFIGLRSSMQLQLQEADDEMDYDEMVVPATEPALLDVPGILGTLASIVVLRSEFVLKTTGCGLPAGPFGIVGAVEGISYLGVVATCASAIVGFVSDEKTKPPSVAKRVAISLSGFAAVVGLAVLAFQLTDYGYIPNAVPMEGGMCE